MILSTHTGPFRIHSIHLFTVIQEISSHVNIIMAVLFCKRNESEYHYLVVTSVAKCSDCHYILPQMSLPSSDIHFHFFTEYMPDVCGKFVCKIA